MKTRNKDGLNYTSVPLLIRVIRVIRGVISSSRCGFRRGDHYLLLLEALAQLPHEGHRLRIVAVHADGSRGDRDLGTIHRAHLPFNRHANDPLRCFERIVHKGIGPRSRHDDRAHGPARCCPALDLSDYKLPVGTLFTSKCSLRRDPRLQFLWRQRHDQNLVAIDSLFQVPL